MRIIAAAAVLCLVAPTAAQSNCATVEKLRSLSKTYFSSIQGKHRFGDYYNARWMLDGAISCEVHVSSSKIADYACTWNISPERQDASVAKAAFEQMLKAWGPCVTRPRDLQRWPVSGDHGPDGEKAELEDRDSNMPEDHGRRIWIEYEFTGQWWTIEMRYHVNDEPL